MTPQAFEALGREWFPTPPCHPAFSGPYTFPSPTCRCWSCSKLLPRQRLPTYIGSGRWWTFLQGDQPELYGIHRAGDRPPAVRTTYVVRDEQGR